MKVTVEAFGPAKVWLGSELIRIDVALGATVEDVASELSTRYPDFTSHRQRCAFALPDRLVTPDEVLGDGAQLSLIPPVSGG